MKKGSKVAMIVVLLLVVVFGVGQFFASPIAPAPAQPADQNANGNATPPTQVLAYASPAPAVALASGLRTASGSCWTSSIAAPYRKDAWRCAVGNGISDPCFQIASSTSLICGVNPKTSSSEFLLELTKPLPAPESLAITPPANWGWLIELADGTLCSPFTGTRPFAAGGEVASYACAPGPLGKDIMIFDDLNASTSAWTAKIGALAVSTSTKQPPTLIGVQMVNVKTVWQ